MQNFKNDKPMTDSQTVEEQFTFRRGMGTRNAIKLNGIIVERCIERGRQSAYVYVFRKGF